MIKHFISNCDDILIGGAMAFTFIKSMGHNIGRSLYQEEMLEECEKIINGEYKCINYILNMNKISIEVTFK